MERKPSYESWSSLSESALTQNFPLHRACRDGDVALLTNLLQQKDTANVHMCLEDTYYGWTPLHWASYFGKLDCVRVLLQASNRSTVNLQTTRFNQTPSHIAAFAGHLNCLQLLIQSGADINVQDYLSETALHKAARTGSEECVALLVNNKAVIGLKNNSNKTPADLANLCRHEAVANLLYRLPKQESVPGRPLISSSGYYGYHPLNGGIAKAKSNGVDADASMEMDTEETSGPIHVAATNGFHNPTMNGVALPNGHAFTNGTTNGHTNGVLGAVGLAAGLRGDITLSEEVSQNRIPIAGKKRSREEVVYTPQTKRIRTEGLPASDLAYKNPLSCFAHPTEDPSENGSPSASLTAFTSRNSSFPNTQQSITNGVTAESLTKAPQIRLAERDPGQIGAHDKTGAWTSDSSLIGGWGHNVPSPLPIPAVSVGYMGGGLGGCIDARPRCLLGHYM